MGNNDKLSVVLEEARQLGIDVLPPSIATSQVHFTVDQGNIRFGMGAVKGAGTGAIEKLIEARDEHGPFTSIFSMTKNLDLSTVGKRTLEALAQAGALDALPGHRAQLAEAVDAAVRYGQKVQADRAAGQNSLFGGDEIGSDDMEPALPRTEEWSKSETLKREHEVLSFYVSGHPLDEYRAEADAFASARFGNPERLEQMIERASGGDGRNRGPVRTFCGIITEVSRNTTRSGKPIAFATIEDFTGQGEMVCFSSVLDRIQPYLEVDKVVLVKGNVEVRGGTVKVIAKEVTPMWKVREQMVKEVAVRLDLQQVTPDDLMAFRGLCERNRGSCKLFFDVEAPEIRGRQRMRARTFVIEPTAEFMRGAQRLFGEDAISLKGN
jgi:DNA polymerase-3 subunit alpha